MNSRQVASRLNEAELQRYASAPLWASPGVALPWPEALRDKPSLAAAWSTMPRPAAAALNIILGRFGALPFKEEQMLGFSEPGIAGADYRIGLLMLAESGIIFAVRKGWGEKLYFLPRDTFLPWHHTLFGSFIPPAAGAVGDADIIFEENDVYIPELGLQLLHALAELVRSGMHKTVKGMLTKRTIEKCSSQMAVQPRDLSLIGLKSVPFAEYPLPLAFVLEIASRKGWLSEDVDAFRLHSGRLQEWFELTGEQRESGLLQLMIEQYAVLDSSIAGAAAVTAALASGQWYRISDVEKQVDQHAFTGDK
ncbi:hypothetical protein K0U00_40435, partial [Paenibacillus sepulcri]|nr:hypothetical protein [Paenibacillus sepulcri]